MAVWNKVNSRRLRWIAAIVALVCVATGLLRAADPEVTRDSDAEFAASAAAGAKIVEPAISAEQREHWAFRPLGRPTIADVKRGEWCRTGVDRFVLGKLEAVGLEPTPTADRRTLVRRLTFDLIGLPPSPDEIAAFLADTSPDAYERLVDRLLASPAHGERMAQPWLDLARFAETDGFEHDLIRKNAWRYRDWVIDAINADMPYDRFVALQLAGDELEPNNRSSAVATGFCVAGPDMPDLNSQLERRHNVLNDVASTVGSVFLGLQMGCAQCHDHKYDPISQGDFYRLRACFESAVVFEKNKPNDAMRVADKPMTTHMALRGDFRRPGPVAVAAVPRIADLWNTSFVATSPSVPAPTPASPESSAKPSPRMQLAAWITRKDHPLATRVIVNRLWQQHFGEGLSRTASDFGAMGDEPGQGELLDWLARELAERDASLKAMRRLLVTSAAYRQASRLSSPGWTDAERSRTAEMWRRARSEDAENRLWWKYPRRRLEGEMLRDAMLSVSGTLSTRRGGPGVMQPLPAELTKTLLANQWKVDPDVANHHRRSVYLFARRNLRDPLLDVFDRPDANASCPLRNRSTTAPQALELLNSEATSATAHEFADRLLALGGDDETLVRSAFQAALGRAADDVEICGAIEFLRVRTQNSLREAASPNVEKREVVANFCLALFSLSEFLYVD